MLITKTAPTATSIIAVVRVASAAKPEIRNFTVMRKGLGHELIDAAQGSALPFNLRQGRKHIESRQTASNYARQTEMALQVICIPF